MLLIAAVLAALLQDQIDNPEYKGWATFKPGSSVTYKYSAQLGFQKNTLKTVSDTEVVLMQENSKDGTWTGKGLERKIPAKLSAELAPKNVKDGEEEIEVAGKTMKCKTREWDKVLPSGKTSTIKVWATGDIPGKGAQVLVLTEGSRFQMTATEWESK
jgi:hypothetical protein